MENIKLAIFDIDGTLLAWGSDTIESSTVNAIHQLKENGIQVLVATGRAYYFIKPHVREVLNCDYYVTINGGCVLNNKGEIVKQHPIQSDTIDFITDKCLEDNAPMALKTSKEMVVYHDYAQFINYYGSFNHAPVYLDDSQNRQYHREVESAKGCFIYSNHREALMEAIQIKKDIRLFAVGNYGIDIFSLESDKIHGIEEVIQSLGITWENTIAFGDENNDLSMIQKAKIGVVMGNGTEEMKAIANYVTANVNEGGIHQALKHFKLI